MSKDQMESLLVQTYIRHRTERDALAYQMSLIGTEMRQASGQRYDQLVEALADINYLYEVEFYVVKKLERNEHLRKVLRRL